MNTQKYIPLIARTFIAIIFVQTGIAKIFGFAGLKETISGQGLPLAGLLAVITIVVEVLGGISLILGFKARIGAIALIIFLIPTTLIFHNPILDGGQLTQFLKNLSIIGGLLVFAGNGPGALSLDRLSASTESTESSGDNV